MDETINQVAAIFADRVDQPVECLGRDTSLRDWGGMDSLILAEFFMELEEELGVELPDRECACFKTLGDVVDFIERERE